MSNELKTGGELVFDFLVMSYELCRLGVDTPCGTRGPNGTGVFCRVFDAARVTSFFGLRAARFLNP